MHMQRVMIHEYTGQVNFSIWKARVRDGLSVNKSTYIFTVLSLPPLTTLSATKSTQYTSSVCPGKSVLSLYVFKFQIYRLVSIALLQATDLDPP
jgi:hypothetical protein